MSDNTSGSSGPGFITLLAILFIGLKLVGVITWPWWVVLSPIWASWAFIIVVVIILVIADSR